MTLATLDDVINYVNARVHPNFTDVDERIEEAARSGADAFLIRCARTYYASPIARLGYLARGFR